MMRSRTWTAAASASAVLMGMAGLLTATTPALGSSESALVWGDCPASVASAPFQCATAPVPLDYAKPGGQQIGLSLIRLPAAVPSERIGSLFINFGGPGGSGVS